ncbi:hypothetical protein LCGC14_2422170, partial [marine sediment metagenome]
LRRLNALIERKYHDGAPQTEIAALDQRAARVIRAMSSARCGPLERRLHRAVSDARRLLGESAE